MKLQTTIFSLGIAVVLALFINVAFSIAYERPQYPDQSKCYPEYIDGKATTVVNQAACDAEMESYNTANERYNMVFFIVSLIIGVALLSAGLYFKINSSISWGIMFAGLFQLIFGTAQYWGELNKFFKLVILGISLAVLFMMAIKFIKE